MALGIMIERTRRRLRRREIARAGLALLGLAVATSGGALSPQTAAAELSPPPKTDHHMHIFSPEAARVLSDFCRSVGAIKCPPTISIKPSTGQGAVEALNSAGIKSGVLLSTAYFYGSPEVARLGVDVASGTRRENAFVVGQAQAQCGRLVAFISVDPLSPNALDELAYWRRKGGATGLKLHLENSDFNFRSPRQVRKLAAVFLAARRAGFPIIVHLQTRSRDYGATDVGIFLRDVLPFAGGIPVQIAHAAGDGGVSSQTLSALGAFADATTTAPSAVSNLYFDLAMVPGGELGAGKLAQATEHLAALENLMRKIGINRFLLGSDWTYPSDLRSYYTNAKSDLGLTGEEWRVLASNQAPYLPPSAEMTGRCKDPSSHANR